MRNFQPKQGIVLIGGGGHCKSCIDVIEQEGKYHIMGIVDKPEKLHESVLSYEIIGNDDDIESILKIYNNFFISIGYVTLNRLRQDLFNKVKNLGLSCPTIISPHAYISKHACIEEGTIIMHKAIVNAGTRIGKNCIINTGSIIEHDVIIDHHCHVAPGAVINGGTTIGSGSFIGSNSVCREYITIGKNSFIRFHSQISKSIKGRELKC